MIMNRIERAKGIALRWHGTQRYGKLPYSHHLRMVYNFAVLHRLPEDYLVAAWLHDTLEDTPIRSIDISFPLGENVLTLVWAVSGFGETRQDRNEDVYCKLSEHPEAIPLKLCDRLANGTASLDEGKMDLFNMYKGEYSRFRDKLHPLTSGAVKGSARVHIGCAGLWNELDRLFVEPKTP